MVIRKAIVYFLIVFSLGFLFNVVKEMLLLPVLHDGLIKLVELPTIILAIFYAARYFVNTTRNSTSDRHYLMIGGVTMFFLIVVELTLAFELQGITFEEYMQSRDVVSVSEYVLTLLFCMLAPWIYSTQVYDAAKRDSH